jgi:flagellin
LADVNNNTLGIAVGDTIDISYVMNGNTVSTSLTVGAATDMAALTAAIADANAATPTYGGTAGIALTADAAGFNGAVNGLTITVKDTNGVVRAGATNALSSFTETRAAENVRTDGQATFQIGANTSQNMQLSIDNMSSAALGVNSLKIGNQGQANVAIKVIDTATQKVSAQRSELGAIQNRLEHTINNLGTASENLTAAESRVRDVDMAKEMMEFTKNNILSQAAQAMLAQANQQPQGVLQLLR